MRVRTIQPRFEKPFPDGIKITTIRKKPWKVGETYDIRVWTGKPYRSKRTNRRSKAIC